MIFFKYLFIFLLFSFVGWILELVYRSYNSKNFKDKRRIYEYFKCINDCMRKAVTGIQPVKRDTCGSFFHYCKSCTMIITIQTIM